MVEIVSQANIQYYTLRIFLQDVLSGFYCRILRTCFFCRHAPLQERTLYQVKSYFQLDNLVFSEDRGVFQESIRTFFFKRGNLFFFLGKYVSMYKKFSLGRKSFLSNKHKKVFPLKYWLFWKSIKIFSLVWKIFIGWGFVWLDGPGCKIFYLKDFFFRKV